MKYFIIAGEPSGDLHGANLMRGLRCSDSAAEFRFWGGDKMAEVGGEQGLLMHYKENSFFGFVQVALNLPTILRQMNLCKRQIADYKPDVVILIDYAGFNLKMAKFAHSLGITTHFYIAPKVWAWNEARVKKIKAYVDELFIIFPFESEYFARNGISAHFEGNPLLDALEEHRGCKLTPSDFRKNNGLTEGKPIIALLAGSRRSEIKANLPLMAAAAKALPDYQFVVAGVSWIDKRLYSKAIGNGDITLIENQTYELLQQSEAAIVTSGTATLETALLWVPEVVLFRLPWLHNVLKGLLLKVPYISLVNLVLGREAVREIMQSSSDATTLIKELKKIINGGESRQRILNDYADLEQRMGSSGASQRFADKMIKLLK